MDIKKVDSHIEKDNDSIIHFTSIASCVLFVGVSRCWLSAMRPFHPYRTLLVNSSYTMASCKISLISGAIISVCNHHLMFQYLALRCIILILPISRFVNFSGRRLHDLFPCHYCLRVMKLLRACDYVEEEICSVLAHASVYTRMVLHFCVQHSVIP